MSKLIDDNETLKRSKQQAETELQQLRKATCAKEDEMEKVWQAATKGHPVQLKHDEDPTASMTGNLAAGGVSMIRIIDGLIMDVNTVFERITGFEKAAVVGRRSADYPLHQAMFFIPSLAYMAKWQRSHLTIDQHVKPLPPADHDLNVHIQDPDSPSVKVLLGSSPRGSLNVYGEGVPLSSLTVLPAEHLMATITPTCAAIAGGGHDENNRAKRFQLVRDFVDRYGNGVTGLPMLVRHHTGHGLLLESIVLGTALARGSGGWSYYIYSTPDSRRYIQPTHACSNCTDPAPPLY